jgi:hypothetical protein
VADRLEHLRDAEPRELAREHRLIPARGHERLRRQVVDFVRLDLRERRRDRILVEQVALVKRHAVADVRDALEFLFGRPAHHPVHLVALREQ